LSRVFLNYRSSDTAALAALMEDQLARMLGDGIVFRDDSGIPAGTDFRSHLFRKLGGCDVMLTLIGPRWFELGDGGRPRLQEPGDFVRQEIEMAIDQQLRIIPVMAGFPGRIDPELLPASLRNLAYLQYFPVRERKAVEDVRRLGTELAGILRIPVNDERKDRDRNQDRDGRGTIYHGTVHNRGIIAGDGSVNTQTTP
jgi:hypothetical protein